MDEFDGGIDADGDGHGDGHGHGHIVFMPIVTSRLSPSSLSSLRVREHLPCGEAHCMMVVIESFEGNISPGAPTC